MTESLKILWITERYPPLSGGMATSAERQVNGLRKSGLTVDVVVFISQGDRLVVKRQQKDNGRDLFFSHPDETGNVAQRAWREVQFQQADGNYDLVVGFGAGFPGYVAVTYAAWLGIPSIVSVRGNDFDRDWFEMKKSLWVNESLKRADAVAVVSPEKGTKIRGLFPDKHIFWAQNGIDADQYDLLPAEVDEAKMLREELGKGGRRIFGIFGELKYKKRIPFWLSAVRSAGLMDKISLLIVGRMDAETDAILNDPILSPVSKHFSFRDQDRLPPLYAASDFILLPSLFEGFPNALLEAMASGSVPVVSDAGAMGDIIENGVNGFVFEAENRAAAAEAAERALGLSDADLDRMKALGRDEVRQRFTPENEIRILFKEIARLTGG